jgi:hypothetical protein
MKKLITVCMTALLMLSAGELYAECQFPSADDVVIPDGSKASKDELIAAITRVKEYQAKMAEFRECLDAELAAMEQPPVLEASQFHDLRYNASISEEEEVAARLNSEIRAFKAREAE